LAVFVFVEVFVVVVVFGRLVDASVLDLSAPVGSGGAVLVTRPSPGFMTLSIGHDQSINWIDRSIASESEAPRLSPSYLPSRCREVFLLPDRLGGQMAFDANRPPNSTMGHLSDALPSFVPGKVVDFSPVHHSGTSEKENSTSLKSFRVRDITTVVIPDWQRGVGPDSPRIFIRSGATSGWTD
jgi:hypothetical protein